MSHFISFGQLPVSLLCFVGCILIYLVGNDTVWGWVVSPLGQNGSGQRVERCQAVQKWSTTIGGRDLLSTTRFMSAAMESSSSDNQEHYSFDSLMEMDVILFQRQPSDAETDDENSLLELGAMQEDGTVAPLSTWSEQESGYGTSIEFVVDEELRFPGLGKNDIKIIKVIGEESIGYGSRQVGGGKGPGNPHGEDSETLYYVERDELEGVELVVNPDLEITW